MINSRAKGQRGEREFAALIFDNLGVRLKRNLQQTAEGGHDLIANAGDYWPFAAEIKNCQTLSVDQWWEQAVEQAYNARQWPLLAYKVHRKGWRVVLPVTAIQGGRYSEEVARYRAEMDLQTFYYIYREIKR